MISLTRLKPAVLALTLYAAGVAGNQSGPHEMTFTPLTEGIWMYTGRGEAPGFGSYLYNGVVAIDSGQAVVIDLPQNTDDASQLLEWIKQKEAAIAYAVPQHWHDDSAGKLALMYKQGVRVVMLDKTFDLLDADQRGEPDVIFSRAARLKYGRRYVDLAYHGGGHSTDGIVAWFGDARVLVGGCMLKAVDAPSLGNLADADMTHYLTTVSVVKGSYPDARVVTPGHGPAGDTAVIDRTIELLKELPPTG